MKILFLCHRFPFPPQRGGKIRPFNVIKHLAQNHELTVVSPVRSAKEAQAGLGLSAHCSHYFTEVITRPMVATRILIKFPTGQPLSMSYFYSKKLYKCTLKEIAGTKFDLIFVHCSSMAQYVAHVTEIPKILDFGDMDSQKWLAYGSVRKFPLNMIYHIEGVRLQKAEARLANKFDYCTCTTVEELKTLRSYNLGTQSGWFPNGVDFDYFRQGNGPYEPDTICFIGRMDYYPNQEGTFDFYKNVLPLIRAKRPQAKLFIIGAEPSRAVRRLENISDVTVTGSVPDVRPYVQTCAVNVAPLNIARGTQNKILESLAMGVPTVTSVQASSGVDAVPGQHFLVASSHQEFASAVVRLLADEAERHRFSQAGRARMLSHHSWEGSMKRFDKIMEDCLVTGGK